MSVLNAILPSDKVQRLVPLVAYHARIFMKKKIGCQSDVSLNAILPSDNGLAYGVIHIFVFLTGKLQVNVCEESFHGISGMSFVITLTRPTLMFNLDAILTLYAGWNPYTFLFLQ
jgi:hypothetical protein